MRAPDRHDGHAWSHEPLEETLDGAGLLTVTIVDRLARAGWEQLARCAGIPSRRWRRHHPLRGGAPLIAIVEGRPAFDTAAWARFASLVPGSVALPTRTAARLGVSRAELRPPDRLRPRVLDLLAARRARARLRRSERRLDGDIAAYEAALDHRLAEALAPGDDGTPFEQLPAYALAARLEALVAWAGRSRVPPLVDLASADATAQLLRALATRMAPGEALLAASALSAGGGAARPRHLQALERVARAPEEERSRLLDEWLDALHGWHALRELHLEATPFRHRRDAARRLLETPPAPAAPSANVSSSGDEALDALARRARRLTALRERVARDRGELHAGLRALAWTLAERLERQQVLPSREAAFTLHVDELLAAARGSATGRRQAGLAEPVASEPAARDAQREIRGIPASAGVASGPTIELDEPSLDAAVDGAVLVCRVTDPAWLPLMLRCAALVTERGGPLSHAAIVARELGLPAVVGARDARSSARAFRFATVDGRSGVVSFATDPPVQDPPAM